MRVMTGLIAPMTMLLSTPYAAVKLSGQLVDVAEEHPGILISSNTYVAGCTSGHINQAQSMVQHASDEASCCQPAAFYLQAGEQ